MKIFGLLDTQYARFNTRVKTYLTQILNGFESKYGNATIFGQLINVINAVVQNIMLYIEDSLIEQNKYTAQRKKSIYNLASISGYEPNLGKTSSVQLRIDFTPNNYNSNNIVINQLADINYDQYNSYVDSYKKDYGVDVSGKVVVTMNVELLGIDSESKNNLTKTNDLQITIPLTKEAIDITIDSENINNKDYLVSDMKSGITNVYYLILGIICFVAAIIEFIYGERLYKIYVKGNIYNITVNRILREYDKLIVNGDVSIDENNFKNKIYPETFIELVDASKRLNSPILFYEVVPNEKCFFIIIKNHDLYKFRISKSYLEKEEIERQKEIFMLQHQVSK